MHKNEALKTFLRKEWQGIHLSAEKQENRSLKRKKSTKDHQ